MIQVILMIVGIVYYFRKLNYQALTPSQFPHVPSEVLTEWRTLEIKSIDLFLWGTWGLIPISLAIRILVGPDPKENILTSAMIFSILWLLGFLIWSSIPGTKALNLKKQYGIDWRKPIRMPVTQLTSEDEKSEQICAACGNSLPKGAIWCPTCNAPPTKYEGS